MKTYSCYSIFLIIAYTSPLYSQVYSINVEVNSNVSNAVYRGYYGLSTYGCYSFLNSGVEVGPYLKIFITDVDVNTKILHLNKGAVVGVKIAYSPLDSIKTGGYSFVPYVGFSAAYQFSRIGPNTMMFDDTIKYNEVSKDFVADFILGLRFIPIPRKVQLYTEIYYQIRNPLLHNIIYDNIKAETKGKVYKSFNAFFWSFGIRVLL